MCVCVCICVQSYKYPHEIFSYCWFKFNLCTIFILLKEFMIGEGGLFSMLGVEVEYISAGDEYYFINVYLFIFNTDGFGTLYKIIKKE